MSGNTCGAEFYSDGYMFAPMLPNIPKILKCDVCSNYSWITDHFLTETDYQNESLDKKHIENLTLEEFIDVLKKNIFTEPEKEFYIRQQIRFLFNDQFRYDVNKNYKSQTIEFCEDNLKKLLPFFEKFYNSTESQYVKAEIYRNLGKFEEAKGLFEKIDDFKLHNNIQKLLTEIEKMNKYVIKL